MRADPDGPNRSATAIPVHSEEFKILAEARKRESEIKGWYREKKLSLVNDNKLI